MNSHGLTKENLLAALPQALQRDPSVSALAEGIAEVLAGRPAEIDRHSLAGSVKSLFRGKCRWPAEPLYSFFSHRHLFSSFLKHL